MIPMARVRLEEETNYQVGFANDNNMYFMWGYDGAGAGTGWPSYGSAPAAIPTMSQWSYVVWTVSGSPKSLRTYINGSQINTAQNRSNGGNPANQQLALNANSHLLR